MANCSGTGGGGGEVGIRKVIKHVINVFLELLWLLV